MKAITLALLAVTGLSTVSAAGAQQTSQVSTRPEIVVKTIPLRHLSSTEASNLLQPYARTAGGGAYAVPGVRAITLREVPNILAEMERVLAIYDRSPATVTLNFQLIAAEPVGPRDPAVAGLDSLLRGVLRFSGYRLLRTTV